MLSPEEISSNKERIISLLKSVNREGMNNVLKYLDDNNFYDIPSSLSRHHNWEGGLAQHCLGVYDRLNKTGESLPQDSVIIVSLLHDICKAGKIYRNEGESEWHQRNEEDLQIPGHGNRSVKILEDLCGLELSDQEKNAIRWHMGGYNLSKEEIRDYYRNKNSDLWRLLYNADRYDASHNGN